MKGPANSQATPALDRAKLESSAKVEVRILQDVFVEDEMEWKQSVARQYAVAESSKLIKMGKS